MPAPETARSTVAKPVLLAALVMLVNALAFEFLKQTIFPGITIWRSHALTIAWATALGTIVSYVIVRRAQALHADLERRVDERTAELRTRNQSLQEEIAERRRAQEALRISEAQLRQAQKMEAVGRLAGGIAHDFNNILMVIIGQTELLRELAPPDSSSQEELRIVLDAAQRAARLTAQLLTFSRQRVVAPGVLDVNDLVQGLDSMLRRVIGEDVRLQCKRASGPAPVLADGGQLEQVIVNLVVNARDAMPRGGQLIIEVVNLRVQEAHPTRHGVLQAGDFVMLAITDTGQGIAPEVQERIFEPFFTTKGAGKGTGLGLSMAYGIVAQHGGQIEVYSELERGTTFKIYLPRAATGVADQPVDAPVENSQGSETILLVEDGDDVRRLLSGAMKRQGYTVIEARNGAEALLFSDRFTGQIHLLMSDIVMPEMDGVTLAAEIRKRRPMVPVLYMSGYRDHAMIDAAALEHGTFLSKPFPPSAAVAAVRRLLDSATC